MPYNPNLTDAKDRVRLKIGDVYDQEFLSDGEINFLLSEASGNVTAAAAVACRSIAARVARNTDYRFSTLWDNASQAFEHFTAMAEQFEEEASESSGPTLAAAKHDNRESIFSVGMMDDPSTSR